MSTMVTLECEQCSGPFYVPKGHERRSGKPRKYCSRQCCGAFKKNNPTYFRTRHLQPCEICGRMFAVIPSKPHHTCGNVCGNKWLIANRKRPPNLGVNLLQHVAQHGAWNKGTATMLPMICKQCGQTTLFPIEKHHPPQKVRLFCDKACSVAYQQAHPELAYRWNGGRYEPYGPNWVRQSRAARQRDGHTCQHCGHHQLRPRLDVHHIRSRRDFDGDWEAANDLGNLITLCRSCHRKAEEPKPHG